MGGSVETGYIAATILFLIITATMYNRMLGVAGLPTQFGEWLTSMDLTIGQIMTLYVILLLLLGTILDTASIILIIVPLFVAFLMLGIGLNYSCKDSSEYFESFWIEGIPIFWWLSYLLISYFY